ncbi:hypothetical protein E3A20_11590, partial [Planctomyces bekefii]
MRLCKKLFVKTHYLSVLLAALVALAAVPEVRAGSQTIVAVGDHRACASRGDEVLCWGSILGSSASELPPTLKGVKSLVVGRDHACALHDLGVACWGDFRRGQKQIPPIFGVSALAAYQDNTCA